MFLYIYIYFGFLIKAMSTFEGIYYFIVVLRCALPAYV